MALTIHQGYLPGSIEAIVGLHACYQCQRAGALVRALAPEQRPAAQPAAIGARPKPDLGPRNRLMRTRALRLVIAALLLGLFTGACKAAPPSLCTSEEKVYLTARLFANDGSAPVRDNEAADAPVVSLCLGGAERAPQLVLRQGRIGDTQTVIRSGPRQRFYTFTLIDHPKFGREIVWTRVGSTE